MPLAKAGFVLDVRSRTRRQAAFRPTPSCARVLALVVAVAVAGIVFARIAPATQPPGEAAPNTATAAQIVARLEQGQSRDDFLFDMHGNANDDLQRLMVLRFGATDEVTRGIDRMDGEANLASARSALFSVLGFVKDPAAIQWLRELLHSNPESFYRDYLPFWRGRRDGYGSWEWLTGRDRWIAFWLEAFQEERSPERRVDLLCVLCQFDDAKVVSFFAARRTEAKDPKEVLVVESYLSAHGVPANDARVVWAVDALRRAPKNTDFLISIAGSFRHEAFVPFLVDVSDKTEPNSYPPYHAAERDLQGITFECTLHGKPAWQRWYVAHGKENRAAWTLSAVDTLRADLARNPKQAAQRFDKLIHCWDEIAMLPFVEATLAPHAEFHSAIAGWINLTYSDFDRERLRPLAERIGTDRHIEPWARRLLEERGYASGSLKPTWADSVQRDNMRM